MTISFIYIFDSIFFFNLIKEIAIVLMYLMFILSSKNQPQENKSNHLLRNAGIFGMILSSIPLFTPVLYCFNCSASEIAISKLYGFSIGGITYIPMLVSSGISLYLLGKRNKERYGKILVASGILWLLGFFGIIIGLASIAFNLWALIILGIISYCAFPASILLIAHGVKFKDKFFTLAGILYLVSWLSIFGSLIMPLNLL